MIKMLKYLKYIKFSANFRVWVLLQLNGLGTEAERINKWFKSLRISFKSYFCQF